MFKAIVENDGLRVRELMTQGYDINSRPITEDVGPLMFRVWNDKCDGATIFFDVFHATESLRPRLLHLAIFFCSIDPLKELVNAGVCI